MNQDGYTKLKKADVEIKVVANLVTEPHSNKIINSKFLR